MLFTFATSKSYINCKNLKFSSIKHCDMVCIWLHIVRTKSLNVNKELVRGN